MVSKLLAISNDTKAYFLIANDEIYYAGFRTDKRYCLNINAPLYKESRESYRPAADFIILSKTRRWGSFLSSNCLRVCLLLTF